MAIKPDLLYYLNTDAATCKTNQGEDGGATAATFINHAHGTVADAIAYTANSATVNNTNSLSSNYAPTGSYAVAMCVQINNTVDYQHLSGIRKTSATATTFHHLRTDNPTKTMQESAASGGGTCSLMEPGWTVIGLIMTSPTAAKYYNMRYRVVAAPVTMANDITGNDATGFVTLGGAGIATGYSNTVAAEFAVWKTANLPSLSEFQTALGQMQERCFARGLPLF